MRLGKRTASAMLAFALAAAVTGTSISVPVPMQVQAAETEMAMEAEVETTASAEEGITLASTEEDESETEVVIDKVTIADTYYSVDGKFPLYVEYFTSEELEYSQYENLELTVIKEDGTVVAEGITDHYDWEEYLGSFQFDGCKGVEIGKTYSLTFVIKDISSGKELFQETKKVGFEEKDVWTNIEYLPTGEKSYSIALYIATGAAVVNSSAVDGIYLLDKDNHVVADSGSDVDIDQNTYDGRNKKIFSSGILYEGWKSVRIGGDLYRKRKLEAGEILELAYSMDERIIKTGIKLTVTNQPYITGVTMVSNPYSGEENLVTIAVNGKHIDFDKLSFVLKDRKTGKEVANSVSSVTRYQNSAYYAVKWSKEYKDKGSVLCDIEYQYSDADTRVIDEYVYRQEFSIKSTEDILWNPKTDSIEYHNSRIPIGTSVSYEIFFHSEEPVVTGSGIMVDEDHHMEVVLKETFDCDGWFDFWVSYLDTEGKKQKVGTEIAIYKNKQTTGSGSDSSSDGKDKYSIYSYIMNPMYYLSDSKCAFSAELICNDESKLVATGSAVIYDEENQEVGNVELSREQVYGNKFAYKGTYQNGLTPGKYRLNFSPDKDYAASYEFYVQDRTILGLYGWDENISSGFINLEFTSKDIAEWYCNEENQKKFSVRLSDIHGKNIATYNLKDGDFSISDSDIYSNIYRYEGSYSYYYNSTSKNIIFSKEVKEKLDEIYFCYVSLYYDGKRAVHADTPSESISSSRYIRSENSSDCPGMGYNRSSSSYAKGQYTYNCIRGSESVFPAVLTITDWYSMKKLKEIKIESPRGLTEEDIKGLLENKVYGCYLKGANGSASYTKGYLSAGKEYHYHNEFWTVFSDLYHVSGDFDVTFEFTNKSDEYNNWENYVVGFANSFEEVSKIPSENEGYKEYYVLRADNWGWSATGDNITLEGNPVTRTFDWDFDHFGDIMKDSKVTMNIKRTGDDFVVDAKILGADSKNYSYVTKFTTKADKEMTLFFTSEYADVSILSFKDNKAVQPPAEDNNTDKPADNTGTGNNGTNSGNTGSNTQTPPETTKEEPKPEETPAEDTEKEEAKPEETPAEDTNKEETKEPEKEETKKPSKDKTNTSKAKGKLTLKKTKLVINKGQKAKIKITSKLNTKVTYRSLNKKVAAVSSKGTVTAKKAGKTVIVVKANGKKKKVTVTIKGTSEKNGKQIELEEDFSLSASKAVLKKGSKLTIQKASDLSGKVTFRSLNQKIASVSSKGVIKARKKGKTTILIKNGKRTIKLKLTVSI